MMTTTKPYTASIIKAYSGPKRSGKSLLMARDAVKAMLRGKTVWSNIPIHVPKFLVDMGAPCLETIPLDFDSFYMLDEEFQEGVVCIDEAVYVADSRGAGSTKNKLINTVINQAGHRNLDLIYTSKSMGWMDKRLQFETDLRIECFDLALSPWGRENKIIRGDLIRMTFFDMSGAITGKPFDVTKRFFTTKLFKAGHRWWDSYDTKLITDLQTAHASYKLNLRRTISNKSSYDAANMELLSGILGKLRDSYENQTIKCEDFWNIVEPMGLPGKQHAGKYLKELGVTKKAKRGGDIYDLSQLKEAEYAG